MLKEIDDEIYNCNLCSDMVEKFPNSKLLLSRIIKHKLLEILNIKLEDTCFLGLLILP